MIALARHGETDYNAEGRFQGQGDIPLNAVGEGQAVALGAQCAAEGPWSALWASPIRRARQTAEAVAAATGLQPRWDERLAETDTGDWTDRRFADVQEAEPELWAAWQAGGDWRFPGGESLPEQLARVLACLDDVRAGVGEGEAPALVVCHRGVIRLTLCHEQGRSLADFQSIVVPNGSLVRL